MSDAVEEEDFSKVMATRIAAQEKQDRMLKRAAGKVVFAVLNALPESLPPTVRAAREELHKMIFGALP
jgi:hypothetical protein